MIVAFRLIPAQTSHRSDLEIPPRLNFLTQYTSQENRVAVEASQILEPGQYIVFEGGEVKKDGTVSDFKVSEYLEVEAPEAPPKPKIKKPKKLKLA